MPSTFFAVIGSLRKIAARIIAHNGMLVVMIEAFTGEVMPTPRMKLPWLRTTPSSDAPKSLARSFGGTCSDFRKNERIQNRIMAPTIRRSVTASGVTILPSITNLATGDISPQIALAPNMAPCPFQLIVCMIFTVIRRSRDRCESDFFDSCFFIPAVSFSDFEIRPSLFAGRAFSQMISFEKSGLPAKAEQMAAGGKRILPIIAIG